MACCFRDSVAGCIVEEGTDILTYLIQRGANLNLAGSTCEQTALHVASAIYNRHLPMAVLFRHGANADLADDVHSTDKVSPEQ
jgi:hypothetical protein